MGHRLSSSSSTHLLQELCGRYGTEILSSASLRANGIWRVSIEILMNLPLMNSMRPLRLDLLVSQHKPCLHPNPQYSTLRQHHQADQHNYRRLLTTSRYSFIYLSCRPLQTRSSLYANCDFSRSLSHEFTQPTMSWRSSSAAAPAAAQAY